MNSPKRFKDLIKKNNEEVEVFEAKKKEFQEFKKMLLQPPSAIILALVNKVKTAEPKAEGPAPKTKSKVAGEEEEELVKVLSKKEIELLTKATAKAYALLTTLPPPPYVNILLGLKLGDLNSKELCSYWFDIAPRITGVSGLADEIGRAHV